LTQLDYSGSEQAYYNKNYDHDLAGMQGYRQQMCHQHHLLQQQHQQWFHAPYHLPHHDLQQQQPSTSPYASNSYEYSSHGYDFSNPGNGYSLMNAGMNHNQHQQPAMDHYNNYAGNGYNVNYDHQANVSNGLSHHHQSAPSADGYCL
jgi:hypothetical protein